VSDRVVFITSFSESRVNYLCGGFRKSS